MVAAGNFKKIPDHEKNLLIVKKHPDFKVFF